MATHHIGILRVLVAGIALLVGTIHCTDDGQETATSQDHLVFNYNCTEHGHKDFDIKELPESYPELWNFTICDCETVDFQLESSSKLLQWKEIQFRQIKTLKLRLTQLPTAIESIEIDNVHVDDMSITQVQLESTLRINSLEIKNSVLKSTSMKTFLNPTFINVTFCNVTFHNLYSNDLAFKFFEDSHFKIVSSVFQNKVPKKTIASKATHIHVEDTKFVSKLMQNAIKFIAGETITIKSTTFADLDEESFELSAPSVQLLNNTFEKTSKGSIVMLNYDSLMIAKNTFWQNVINPIYWKQNLQETLPDFVSNIFQCDTSASSNATVWIVDTVKEYASENQTFCEVMAANNYQDCDSQTSKFLREGCGINNCTVMDEQDRCGDSGKGSSKQMSTVVSVISLVIFKLLH